MHSLIFKRAALGAVLTALLLWPALAQQELQITIARIGGTVEVQHATTTKGKWVKAKKDQVIGAGWTLRTAADSKVQLVFPQDNVVILKASSVLTVDALDAGGGAKVNAKSGGLLVDIKRALSPGSTFEVKTPSALAVVRGTKFGVEIGPAPASAGAGGGKLVAMNFMFAGQPMRTFQADTSFGVLLGGGGKAADADGDGRADLVISGADVEDWLGEAEQRAADAAVLDAEAGSSDKFAQVRGYRADSDEDGETDAPETRAEAGSSDKFAQVRGFKADLAGDDLILEWDAAEAQPEQASGRSFQKALGTVDRRTISANDFHHNKMTLRRVGDLDGDGVNDYIVEGGAPALEQLNTLADALDEAAASDASDSKVRADKDKIAPRLVATALLSNRSGGFNDSGEPGETFALVAWDDLDGDGIDDIALLSGDGSVRPRRNQEQDTQDVAAKARQGNMGKAKRSFPGAGDGGSDLEAMEAGDLDGDGKPDYFVSGDADGDGAAEKRVEHWGDPHENLSGKNKIEHSGDPHERTGAGFNQTHNQEGKGRQNGALMDSNDDGDDQERIGVIVDDDMPGYTAAPWDDLDGDGVDDIALLSGGYKAKQGKTGSAKLMDGDGDGAGAKQQPQTYKATQGKSGKAKNSLREAGGGGGTGDDTEVELPADYKATTGKTGRMMNRMVSADGDEVDAEDAGDLDGDGIDDYYISGSKLSSVKNNPLYKGSGPRQNPLAESQRVGGEDANGTPLASPEIFAPSGNAGGSPGAGFNQTFNQAGKGRQNGLALGDLDGDGVDEIGVDTGDLDGDGRPDYLVVFSRGPRQSIPLESGPSGSTDRVKQAMARAEAEAEPAGGQQKSIKQGHYAVSNFSIEIDGIAVEGLPAGDLDGDGVAEIVVGSQQLTGRPVGQPAAAGLGTHVQRAPGEAVVATGDLDGDGVAEELAGEVVDDLDGDGLADIIVSSAKAVRGGGLRFNENQGVTRGSDQRTSGTGPNGQGLRISGLAADLDGDGVADILDTDSDNDGLAELVVGDLDGDGRPERAFPAGDLDGDGNDDLAILSGFSHGEGSDAERKSAHEMQMVSVRNLKGRLAGPNPPSQPAAGDGSVKPGDGSVMPGGKGSAQVDVDKEVWRQDFGQVKADRHERTAFFGYHGKVEIGNEHGVSFMTAGTSVVVDGDGAPSDASPSGDAAQQFLDETEDTALFDQFDAAADAAHADLGPVRAKLQEADRALKVIESEWEQHVRRQDIGKLMLIFKQLDEMRQELAGIKTDLAGAVGVGNPPAGYTVELEDILVSSMQEQGIPDTDLPGILIGLNQRIEDLLVDLEPYLKGQDELLERTEGLLDPGDPRGSIRNDLLDTDNDGIGDALELELGTDPMLNNSADGFIELVAPDDADSFNFPPDADLEFEFEPLDTDVDVTYNLVLEAGGQQAVRRGVRERERFTLAQLAGPQGLLAGAVDASGALTVNWYVEAQLRRARGGAAPAIRSEARSFTIQTPANSVVEVNLRSAAAARLGSPVQVTADITEVNALGAWEIEIDYDPLFLTFAQGSKTGLFNSSTVFFNDAGNGRLVASGQVPAGSAGISGEGDIFVLTFTPLAAGTTTVEAVRVTLSDTLDREIEGRPGDEAEVSIARRGSTSPGGASPGGTPVTPSGSGDSAGLPSLGPLMLSAPANGSTVRYPAETELEFEFEELNTGFDVVYNLILISGGKQKKLADFASGDSVPLQSLLNGGGPAGAGAGAGGGGVDWRVEAEVDTGGSQPMLVVSDTWHVSIGGPQNGTITLDLSAMGSTRNLAIGDPVRIRGSLSEVEGLGDFQLVIRYDSGVLDFASGRRTGLFNSASVRIDSAGPGKVIVSGSASGAGLSGSGDCFELEFTASGDGSAVIEPAQVELTDILGTTLDGSAGDSVDVDVDPAAAGGAGAPGGGKDPFGKP